MVRWVGLVWVGVGVSGMFLGCGPFLVKDGSSGLLGT